MLGQRLHGLTNPLVTQLVAVGIAVVVVITIAMLTSDKVIESSQGASREAQKAALASTIKENLDQVDLFLRDSAALLDGGGSLTLPDAVEAHEFLAQADRAARELVAVDRDDAIVQVQVRVEEATASLDTFYEVPTMVDLDNVSLALGLARDQVQSVVPQLVAQSDQYHAELRSTARFSRIAIVVTGLSAGLAICLTTYFIGRRHRKQFLETQAERDHLEVLTAEMRHKNDQFAALYSIVSEVTESLSVRYVVNTTVHEARKLVQADYVAVRLLEGNILKHAGSIGDHELPLSSLADLPLGTGIVGAAAKRGRTARLEENAHASMASEEKVMDVESGVVIPLIVGARVLGTLACWSKRRAAFTADDERVLEMMASQVATAVAAANLHESSEKQASHDALTGLPNRRQLLEDETVFAEMLRNDERFAVLMYDIDHFKSFNDDFGHKVGDVTLQKVAEVLKNSVREGDRIYRYGGEEFLVVFSDVDRDEAQHLAERLRRSVEKTPLTGENLEPVGPVTISAGLALAPEDGTTFDVLLAAADRALYRSKDAGRNRVTFAGDGLAPENVAA
jgi:diguanylate cyclase (GGDEF)-like protein